MSWRWRAQHLDDWGAQSPSKNRFSFESVRPIEGAEIRIGSIDHVLGSIQNARIKMLVGLKIELLASNAFKNHFSDLARSHTLFHDGLKLCSHRLLLLG
jgi:hypothetical protein